MLDRPLRFSPFLRPMVWGGRKLGEFLREPLADGELYGEAWQVSDHALHRSLVEQGARTGTSLRQLMEQHRQELLGSAATKYQVFPWLIKILDACDWLSVQVHPNEEAVSRLWPGEGSKTEAWFIVDAHPASRIYAGLLPGVDEPALRRAIKTGSVAECLHVFTPRPGDCVFLPAGTVHAVGGGVLMAEVQQTSDATFRLFDWNRRDQHGVQRQLHIEESIASINWNQGPVQPCRAMAWDASVSTETVPERQQLVRCRYFELEFVRPRREFPCGGMGRLQAATVLGGRGVWRCRGIDQEIESGQTWLLPAAMAETLCVPAENLSLLWCSLP